jgi:hypothetical protein
MPDPMDEFPHMPEGSPGPLRPLPPLPIVPATSLAALAPPQPALLGPLAPGTITLIRGPRGAGKSWLALAMAHAVASDAALLGWRARPAPVLHVEAVMGQAAIAARLRALGPAGPDLAIVCDCPLDLGDTTDQARIMAALPEGGLLVLDGVSLLMPAGAGPPPTGKASATGCGCCPGTAMRCCWSIMPAARRSRHWSTRW